MNIRSIIIDDEIQAINNLETILADIPGIEVIGRATESGKAVELIISENPDLVFLDIQMPGMDGFGIARALKEKKVAAGIIFVTAFDEFAIEAIRHSAFDYLLKPLDKKELQPALERFSEEMKAHTVNGWNEKITQQLETLLLKTNTAHKVKFSTASGFLMIDPKEILYIQADWNYSEIHFDGEQHELVTQNLGSIEKKLPLSMFCRINRSVLINTRFLSKVSRKKRTLILIKDSREYPFRISLLNIRKLERILENLQS